MKFFLNSVNIDEIRTCQEDGLIHGITTNPSLVSRSPLPVADLIQTVSSIVPGPVNVQVTATDRASMIDQARKFAQIAQNIVIKIPITYDGLAVANYLEQEGIKVNLTLCFSLSQAICASNINVSYVSVFSGRLSSMNLNGEEILKSICDFFKTAHNTKTQIIAATINEEAHIIAAARAGADIVTGPYSLYKELLSNSLTTQGIESFLKDWQTSGKAPIC